MPRPNRRSAWIGRVVLLAAVLPLAAVRCGGSSNTPNTVRVTTTVAPTPAPSLAGTPDTSNPEVAAACTQADAKKADQVLFDLLSNFQNRISAARRADAAALTPIVAQMELLRQRLDQTVVPTCGNTTRTLLAAYMDARLNEFHGRVAGEPDAAVAAKQQDADARYDVVAKEFSTLVRREQ